MEAKKLIAIPEVTDSDIAFGTTDGLPAYSKVPAEFKRAGNKWNELFSVWFFGGLKSLDLIPREGIDKPKALRHIRALMRSFEPKHEHKEAGCAYLMSQYFKDAKWERK